MRDHFLLIVCQGWLIIALCSCRHTNGAATAFYYWKNTFETDCAQRQLLTAAAGDKLYLRFFDIVWNEQKQQSGPDAITCFRMPAGHLHITPVVYITNKVFENIRDNAIDSLAWHSDSLIRRITAAQHISHAAIQVDCDWTLTTRDKYFHYLQALKAHSHKQLQTTIRLHQVKYKERTGVPPVDKGILMYYNMGELNGEMQQPSSIYNEEDAQKYVASLPRYPLPLDVALPVFSWTVHIRNGRVIRLYNRMTSRQLRGNANFEPYQQGFRARKSFFFSGVYIKENDIFKPEETSREDLEKAISQLTTYLPPYKQRTIVYYELSAPGVSAYEAKDFLQFSGHF